MAAEEKVAGVGQECCPAVGNHLRHVPSDLRHDRVVELSVPKMDRHADVFETESPRTREDDEVAEEAAGQAADGPRLASLPYLDSLGGDSSLAGVLPAVDELTRDVEMHYKLELS